MLAACAEWGLSVLRVFLVSHSFPFFLVFFVLSQADGLVLDGISHKAIKSKTTSLPAVQVGKIQNYYIWQDLGIFFNCNIVLPENETVIFVLSCVIL